MDNTNNERSTEAAGSHLKGYDPVTGEPIYGFEEKATLTLAQEIDAIADHSPLLAEMLRNVSRHFAKGV